MRASIWLAAGILTVCLVGSAPAQFVATSSSGVSQTPTAGGTPGQESVGITDYIMNTLSFQELFRPILFSNRVNVGTVNDHATTVIPDPKTPDYIASFGYKRLTSLPPKHWWLWWAD
jgi:hypothetical protein